MIDIKITPIAKKTAARVNTGIYGTANSPSTNNTTYSGSVVGDEINAVSINTDILNVGTQATLNRVSANAITTNTVRGDEAHFNYANLKEIDTDKITADEGNISKLISQNINVGDLTVTGSAHFFELVIDEIRAAGGQYILSAAQPFTVTEIEEYANEIVIYFPASDGTKQIKNTWAVNDLLIHRSFNQVEVGNNSNASNKFYWLPVTGVSSEPKEYNGKMLHFVKVSKTKIIGIGNWDDIEIGDNISQLGNLNNTTRQNAIYIAAGETSLDEGIAPPLIAQYVGIKTCELAKYRTSFLSRGQNKFVGNLYVDANTTVDDYIDNKISDIDIEGVKGKDGESSYTIVYDNQMINIPTSYSGKVLGDGTYNNKVTMQLFYGSKIVNDVVNYSLTQPDGLENSGSYADINYNANSYEYIVSFDSAYVSNWNDTNTLGVKFTLPNNKYVNGNIYVNKIKAGENGVTMPTYEIISNVDYVKYDNDNVKIYPTSETLEIKTVKQYDNKYTTLTAFPSTFYYEYNAYLSNGTIYNSGAGYNPNLTLPIVRDFNSYYITNYTINLMEGETLVDRKEIPVLIDGNNGMDGKDAVYDKMVFTQLSAQVGLDGNMVFTCEGTVKHYVGSQISSYNYKNHKMYFIGDNSTDKNNFTQYGYFQNNGNFYASLTTQNYLDALSKQEAPIHYVVQLVNSTGAVLDTETVNVTSDAGAVLTVNGDLQTIEGRVSNNEGAISSLSITTDSISTTVTQLGNIQTKQATDISNIKQQADKIETEVKSISSGGQNIIDRTAFVSYEEMDKADGKTTDFNYHYRDVTGASITIEDKVYEIDSNILHINCVGGVGKGNKSDYVDVMQTMTGKIKTNTYYVLHCKYKTTFNENEYNTNGNPGALYITGMNPTWMERNGVEGNIKNDIYTPLTNTNGGWAEQVIRFKTGELGESSVLFMRCFCGSSVRIQNIKLEEGKYPSAWNISGKDMSSSFTQTAESISMNIQDGLKKTGIDINSGLIQLNADKTIINGSLNINDDGTGLQIIDDGKVAVQIKKQQIGNSDDFSLANQYYLQMSTDESLLNKTYAINTPYDIYTSKYDLGNYNAGEKISITELHLQTYKNVSVNALPIKQYNQSFYVKFYCNGVLKNTITSSVSASLDEYDDYTFNLPDVNYTVETGGIYTVQIGFSGTSPSELNLYYPYNKNPFTAMFSMYVLVGRFSSKITTIGIDGLYSSTGDNRVFWIGTDKMMLKWFNKDNSNENKVYGIEIGDNGIMQICGNKVDDTKVVRKTVLGGYEHTKTLYTKEYADEYYYTADDYCIAKVTAMSNYLAANNTGNYYLYQMTDNDYVIDSCVYNEQTGRVYIALPAYDYTEYIIGRLVKIYNIGTSIVYIIGANGIDINKSHSDTKWTGHANLYKRGTYDKVKQVTLSGGQSADFVFKNGYWEYIKYS